MRPCPKCNGTGEVDDPLMSVALGAVIGCGWFPGKQVCPECDGTGVDNRHGLCNDEGYEAD